MDIVEKYVVVIRNNLPDSSFGKSNNSNVILMIYIYSFIIALLCNN